MQVGTNHVTVHALHNWPDGQTLGYAKFGNGHWQHVHNLEAQVGPVYPTREALMLHTVEYQRTHWGI